MSTIHNTLTGSELHNSKIRTGSGSPNFNSLATAVNAWVGDVYLDVDTNTLYVRKGLIGSNDWTAAPIQHIGNHPMVFTTVGAVAVTLPATGTLLSTTSTIPYSALNLLNSIVNSDLVGNISLGKLATLTASRVAVTDASGVLTTSSITPTELATLSGISSNVQTQLNAKQSTGNYLTALSGNVVAAGPGSSVATIQPGVVTNAMLAGGIAYSKLLLGSSVTNADLAGSIAYSKLALGSSIVNTDISASAGIVDTKLATISTPGKVDNLATTATASSVINTIVSRNATGGFSAGGIISDTLQVLGASNLVTVTTSGRAILGNSSCPTQHIIQGTQASFAQLDVINNASTTGAGGLKVTMPNGTNSDVLIQEWTSSGTSKGSVDGAGKWTLGALSGTQTHTAHGTLFATVSTTTPIGRVTSTAEYAHVATPADPTAGSLRVYAKSDNLLYVKGAGLPEYALGAATGSVSPTANSIVQRDTLGSGQFVGLTTTGIVTLGNTSIPSSHTIQGAAPGDYQVKVINNLNASGAHGLRVSSASADVATLIQQWQSGGTVRGSVDGAGKWTLGAVGSTQAHDIRGIGVKLVRPSDSLYQGSTFELANAAGTTQGYVGLGANTGDGLVLGEYNNGLVLKSAAGLVFSGSNNRVDGKMDSAGQWNLGSDDLSNSTAAVAIHKLVRANRGMRVVIPIGNTTQTNPTILEPATTQDNESMRLSAGATLGIKSYVQVKGNWNGSATLGGGIDFVTRDILRGNVAQDGAWTLGTLGTDPQHRINGRLQVDGSVVLSSLNTPFGVGSVLVTKVPVFGITSGGMLVVTYNDNAGVSGVMLYLISVPIAGGAGSLTTSLLGVTGVGTPFWFTFGVSGGFVTITNASGGYLHLRGVTLYGGFGQD